MVKYKAAPKAKRPKLPVWKREHFPRLAGMMDSLLHKSQIRSTGDQSLLHSGRVVRLQCQFDEYEFAMKEYLCQTLSPMLESAQRLTALCTQKVPESAPPHLHTSANLRAARESGARRQQLLTQIRESRAELARLLQQLRHQCEVADSRIQQALARANAELARYAKATRFAVVEQEIPALTRSFYPDQLLDAALIARIEAILAEV